MTQKLGKMSKICPSHLPTLDVNVVGKRQFENGKFLIMTISWPWHWPGSHSIQLYSDYRPLPAYQISFKSDYPQKTFCGWTDVLV